MRPETREFLRMEAARHEAIARALRDACDPQIITASSLATTTDPSASPMPKARRLPYGDMYTPMRPPEPNDAQKKS